MSKIATKLKSLSKRKIFKNSGKHLKLTEADLINAESKLGAMLFGSIPEGHRREFFRYRHNIWVYHEGWTERGKKMESTITYKVQQDGVYKCPLGGERIKITGAELDNFRKATKEYLKLVKHNLYNNRAK